MKKYKVKVVGVTPYMQHRMDDLKLEEWEKNRKLIIERDDIAKEDYVRAMFHAYLDENNKPYIPSDHLRGSMINAGAFLKAKMGNKTKSMKNIVAAMFFVQPEKIYLPQTFAIDKRSAVNKIVKARIISIRPRWDEWSANFELWVDNDTITEETIKELIKTAGQFVGIGSFRPTNNGMYGRFELESFKRI